MISLNLINSNNNCQAYEAVFVTVLMVHIYCFYLIETASSKTTIVKSLVGGGAILVSQTALTTVLAAGCITAGIFTVGGIIYYLCKGRSTCRANQTPGNHQEQAQRPDSNAINQAQAIHILRHVSEQQNLIKPILPAQNQQENNLPLTQDQDSLQPQKQVLQMSELPQNQQEYEASSSSSQSQVIIIPSQFDELSYFSSITTLSSNEFRQLSQFYSCPITLSLIVEPVACNRCLKNFEEVYVRREVNNSGKCPQCRKDITQQNLIPNQDRKKEIKLFRKRIVKKMRKYQYRRIEEDGLEDFRINLIR